MPVTYAIALSCHDIASRGVVGRQVFIGLMNLCKDYQECYRAVVLGLLK
ncbi:hypothetical protein G7B40_033170 [Aetokthonos hydrillicola Thurmond2011]|uniref:Uncharacterized protein n=1 Tax=Aetokthonos hydrillicola Thurmond2011 TaxID=2712845 RepID=A0AAP5IDT6_9CYAN|nr:hypothetical protein [Aetokthonos hydrillicola]MBW4590953.1 hypothetical protein [Aetokthonos hydrillicola CCALA 1050]MDR9899377.1 hypothetical protein [Aetokthonos hydrillicola Thurmond2011]